jgi:transketolase
MNESPINALEKTAYHIRKYALEMLCEAKSGHPGGSLSEAEILSVLYFAKLRIDPSRPNWENRDRFILSKGHACPGLYAVLAMKGYFPEKDLFTLRKLGSYLQGHPDMKKTPGIDISTGSLGQGLSAGLGMALAARLQKKLIRVYVLLGCGESDEGQVWEAAMAAAHYKADHLTAIVDYNRLQLDGPNSQVMGLSPLAEKWRAFGWHVIDIDGHNIPQIMAALNEAEQTQGCPSVIIANTIKGKGVSFMENQFGWHGKAPSREELDKALIELEERMEKI